MAHGEILMLGGYLAWMAMTIVPGPLGLLVALAFALLGAGIFGGFLEVALVSRLTARPLDTLLATWGVSLIMQQAARDLFGATGVSVTAPAWLDGGLTIAGLQLPTLRIFILIVAVAVLLGLAAILSFTRIGLLVRAVNQDRPTAAAMGVNVRLVDCFIFALGAGVAGLGGVVLALLGPVTPNVGQGYIVTAFLVVILGGLGSIVGTTVAALIIGLITALSQIFVDVSFAQVLTLLFVILFLQFRPQGVIAVKSRALDAE